MSTRMTRAEREVFLREVRVGVLGLADSERGPLVVPVWYAYTPAGEIHVVTERGSRKARLFAVGHRISLCVQDEAPPYKYVSVEGPIVAIEVSDLERDERPLAHHYLGRAAGDRYIAAASEGRDEDAMICVRMRPERWLSVDYSKEDVGL
jgi:nitroimidazol reductase NimA-like FMN-containing flavoprotein (pyridoxamine 5'-phosphate oxidase superfamily)